MVTDAAAHRTGCPTWMDRATHRILADHPNSSRITILTTFDPDRYAYAAPRSGRADAF
jgi:hypothetical protein